MQDVGGQNGFGAALVEALTFRAGEGAATVVLGSAALGIGAGVVGVLALLRQRSLLADALAHATLPGIAAAFVTATALGIDGRSMPILIAGALAAGLLALACVKVLQMSDRLTADAVLASTLSVFFGAGVVLMTVVQTLPSGGQAGLERFIYGQAAAMLRSDLWMLSACTLLVLVVCGLLLKELRLVTFDPAFGRAIGRPIGRIDGLVLGMILVITVAGLQTVGLIMIVALQVVPAAAARFWTNRLGAMLVIAGCIGGVSGFVGAAISGSATKVPTGAVIVLVAGAAFVISMVIAPRRGVVAAALRRARASMRIARSHALREIIERAEAAGMPHPHTATACAQVLPQVELTWAQRLGLRWGGLYADGTLTEAGVQQARAVTRAHRLWEQYLVTRARHDPAHADLVADLVEHATDEADVDELQRELEREMGRGAVATLPGSLHPLGVNPVPRHPEAT